MGVNPSDLQVMVSKTVELARQYSQEAQKGVALQQTLAKQEEKIQEENTKRVHDRNEAEKVTIKDEEKSKEQEAKGDKESDEDSEEKKEEKKPEKYKGEYIGHFDMSI